MSTREHLQGDSETVPERKHGTLSGNSLESSAALKDKPNLRGYLLNKDKALTLFTRTLSENGFYRKLPPLKRAWNNESFYDDTTVYPSGFTNPDPNPEPNPSSDSKPNPTPQPEPKPIWRIISEFPCLLLIRLFSCSVCLTWQTTPFTFFLILSNSSSSDSSSLNFSSLLCEMSWWWRCLMMEDWH